MQQLDRRSIPARCTGWLAWLCRLLLILLSRRKGGDPCVYIPERIITRPDPCLYSQFLLMQLGQPVTWDNPDITVFLNGVEQNTYDLLVNTEYDIVVRVHNSSRDKAAAGTQVAVRWIEFGAGAQIQHPIASLAANVPAWPGVAQVVTTWRTPASPGHYCLEVELFHPEDGNPANNRGWNNTQVKAAASEVQTPVRIFNRWPDGCPPIREGGDALAWWRILLGYALLGVLAAPLLGLAVRHHDLSRAELAILLPAGYVAGSVFGLIVEAIRTAIGRRTHTPRDRERISCHLVELTVDSYEFDDQKGKDADPQQMFGPQPPVWPALVDPRLFVFAPHEAYRDVTLTVDAPDTPGPPGRFNVSARQGGVASGGVTIVVTRPEG